jgi:hypothetical protein
MTQNKPSTERHQKEREQLLRKKKQLESSDHQPVRNENDARRKEKKKIPFTQWFEKKLNYCLMVTNIP